MGTLYKFSDLNDLADQVSDFINDSSAGCQTEPRLDDVDHSVIFKPTLDAFNNGWEAIRSAMDAWQAANNQDDSCPPLTWEHPPNLDKDTVWKQETIDEIGTNLSILQGCECCCKPDEDGFGGLTILGSGATLDYTAHIGEPGFTPAQNSTDVASIVAGHFPDPLSNESSPAVATDFFDTACSSGSLSYEAGVRFEVFDMDDNQWKGPTASVFYACCHLIGTIPTAKIPEVAYTFLGGTLARYPFWRISTFSTGTADPCGDCGDDPKPHCGDEGGS